MVSGCSGSDGSSKDTGTQQDQGGSGSDTGGSGNDKGGGNQDTGSQGDQGGSVNLKQGLVGHWPFEEGSGTQTAEVAGATVATLEGSVTWIDGVKAEIVLR